MTKVFLGGTCNNSLWREQLIPLLKIDFFNPVVEDWTEECYQQELQERKDCDYCLYIITPKMTGVYSIAEAVDDSNKRPDKTVFAVLDADDNQAFSPTQRKSLVNTGRMVEKNGGTYINCNLSENPLKKVADFLNEQK